MSREERRAYQRMMKNQERGPALPPAAKARAERTAARRAARRGRAVGGDATFTTRFWLRAGAIALAVGFLTFSLQWPNMPFALYVGLGVAVVALALLVGFRLLQRRVADSRARGD